MIFTHKNYIKMYYNNNSEYFYLNKCIPLFYEECVANEFIKEIEKFLHN